MGTLKEILLKAMSGYAVKGLNGYSVLTSSHDNAVVVIVSVAKVKGRTLTTTSLIARVKDGFIVIEHDINNRPLVDALLQEGIPRSQIILAYAGEPLPQSA